MAGTASVEAGKSSTVCSRKEEQSKFRGVATPWLRSGLDELSTDQVQLTEPAH